MTPRLENASIIAGSENTVSCFSAKSSTSILVRRLSSPSMTISGVPPPFTGTHGSPETIKQSLDDLPGFLVLFENFGRPLPPKEMLMHSLRIAVHNWDRSDGLYDYRGLGQYLYGFRAFKQWAEDIGRHDEWTEKERELLFFVSWWCYCSIADARNTAVAFM